MPDLTVRAAQLYLTYLGYHPGPIDGIAGEHTTSAFAQFQADNHLALNSTVDDECVAQLSAALTTTLATAAG